jgi:hypothetical protein
MIKFDVNDANKVFYLWKKQSTQMFGFGSGIDIGIYKKGNKESSWCDQSSERTFNYQQMNNMFIQNNNEFAMFTPERICDTLFQMDNCYDPKLIYLCNGSYRYQGVKFYGTPWCPSLSNWAFYGDSNQLRKEFDKIDFDTDVLITHCPPKYGLQGVVLENNWNYMSDFGCVELQQVLDELFADRDMWVLSGHIHSGKHDVEKFNNIKYRNCSIKNEDYMVAYQPFEFEITSKE